MKGFCFIIVVAFFVASNEAFNCNQNGCSPGSSHTLCRFPNPSPVGTCGQVIAVGLTNEQKKAIVQKHNDLRQYVASGKEHRGNPGPQPAAADMKNLTWDEEVAKVAQRWANQCDFGHDSCRNVDGSYVGQNVAEIMTTGTPGSNVEDMVQMWYNEVSSFDRNQVDRLTNIDNVGHYTQLVWAKTSKIGCGKILFKNSKWTTDYLVCNYSPGGNVMGSRIYKRRN